GGGPLRALRAVARAPRVPPRVHRLSGFPLTPRRDKDGAVRVYARDWESSWPCGLGISASLGGQGLSSSARLPVAAGRTAVLGPTARMTPRWTPLATMPTRAWARDRALWTRVSSP